MVRYDYDLVMRAKAVEKPRIMWDRIWSLSERIWWEQLEPYGRGLLLGEHIRLMLANKIVLRIRHWVLGLPAFPRYAFLP